MSNVIVLERKILNADYSAVDLAAHLGNAAWPAIQRAASASAYEPRKIAMLCAGKLGGDSAGPILARGLSDENVNIRVAAAAQLSGNPPAGAWDALLNTLSEGNEDDIRALLALGAGYIPGKKTLRILQAIRNEGGAVGKHARMSLAKLGDLAARQQLIRDATSGVPVAKYRSLQSMVYVNDASLASYARKLLADRNQAMRLGPEFNVYFRRVCDQAVDTLVHLLNLKPSFPTSVEKVYSDAEIAEIVKEEVILK